MSTCLRCDSPDIYSLSMCRSCYEKDLRERNPEYAERQRVNSRSWQDRNNYQENPANVTRRNHQRTERRRERLANQLALQDGKCGLCGAEGRAWQYDHDHETGRWRMVLCSKCNNGLGFFDDSPEALRAAARYVERFRGRETAA
jgi:hypothetical protein